MNRTRTTAVAGALVLALLITLSGAAWDTTAIGEPAQTQENTTERESLEERLCTWFDEGSLAALLVGCDDGDDDASVHGASGDDGERIAVDGEDGADGKDAIAVGQDGEDGADAIAIAEDGEDGADAAGIDGQAGENIAVGVDGEDGADGSDAIGVDGTVSVGEDGEDGEDG